MKSLSLIALALLSGGCQHCDKPAPQANRNLYAWGGQSNGVAYAVYVGNDAETADPRITMFKNGAWSPALDPISPEPGAGHSSGLAFARQMLAMNPSTPIGLINCAVGSTIIDEWQPGLPPPYYPERFQQDYPQGLLNNCYDKIDAALRADPTTKFAGFVFIQGESDANVCGHNSPWAEWMRRISADIKARYNNIPIAYAQLGPFMPGNTECNTDEYVESFRAEQASVQGPGLSMFVTKDLEVIPSGVHFTAASLDEIGRRAALKISPWSPSNDDACKEPWWQRVFH